MAPSERSYSSAGASSEGSAASHESLGVLGRSGGDHDADAVLRGQQQQHQGEEGRLGLRA